MQRIIFVFTLFIVSVLTPCGSLSAQQYYVYDVSANVFTMNKKEKIPVTKRQILDGEARLEVPRGGHIMLLSTEPRKSYKIEKGCRGVINKLIGTGMATMEDLSKRYIIYLFKKMLSDSDEHSTKGVICFATYRDLENILQVGTTEGQDTIATPCDTILVSCDSVAVSCDSVAVSSNSVADKSK